ncbi:MAG: DUF262 domain-containing HNH endonuclease family protein [Bacteroides sp.]|nr:DUF262 domain-containing HNH endonuclease family protein [Prevotella sp.]MCM1407822.1 DUF262 domain-containing HNH endonuclease family protein [Treponema brennaborense]MCM1470875.1 DUF262 domain-containing HNH endonuclease family protein [Bacteroides sp.]
MQLHAQSINDVLTKNATSFYIPPYQRSYAWGKTEIKRYFSDILKIIASELDVTQKDKLEHFFGTLVIKNEDDGFSNISVIIDGQQRLTTTLIFLIALRDFEENAEYKNLITKRYLTNESSVFENKIKLKQVTKDWDSYQALINRTEVPEGIINAAYETFSNLIKTQKTVRPQITFAHYIKALQRMNVAVIFLDERKFKGEDPQIIFETLNSLGKPLTLSDLIRNYVLLNMPSSEQTATYDKIWFPKIEKELDESTSEFFRDFLQYKKHSVVKVVSGGNTKEIYSEFKDFVDSEKNYSSHQEFITDITQFVKPYKWIVQEVVTDSIPSNSENDKKIKELLRNIFHDLKSDPFKPFVMGVLFYHQNKKLSDDSLIEILEIVRTYLIRRRILKLAQGENKAIPPFCEKQKIEAICQNPEKLTADLSSLFYNLRFPNDDEIRQILRTANFYEEYKKYAKFILGKIEEKISKVSVDFRKKEITIEHILPQTLSENWQDALGEDADRIQKKYVHNIGNLILTDYNSEMGNKPLEEKKQKLKKSNLNYRLDVINQNAWGESEIIAHRDKMIERFLETFPLPEKSRTAQNWIGKKEIAQEEFSPFDDDLPDFAGEKPALLKINGNKYKVQTWQDVFISFINYVKENKDFQIVLQNQGELFNRDNCVIKWLSLKELIEQDESQAKKYKTFDGIFYDKVKNLTDGIFFVHTNIAAKVCINRISNIMNKFNIERDTVLITLQ